MCRDRIKIAASEALIGEIAIQLDTFGETSADTKANHKTILENEALPLSGVDVRLTLEFTMWYGILPGKKQLLQEEVEKRRSVGGRVRPSLWKQREPDCTN